MFNDENQFLQDHLLSASLNILSLVLFDELHELLKLFETLCFRNNINILCLPSR